MRKLLSLFLCCVLFLLCGCGKSENDDALTFMTWGSESEINIIKSVISDYEQTYKGKKVKLIHTPQNYFPKLHLSFASNLEPDVVFLNNIYSRIYIDSDLLEDLTPYFSDELKEGVFYKSSTDSFSKDGRLYAIPRDISDMVLYINKDIFSKLNVAVPEKFENLDELYELISKLKTESNFSINAEPKMIYWLNFLCLEGGGFLSDDLKNIIITDKQSISALQKYADLASKDNYAPTKSQIASKTTAQMFINGELAMYLSGRWMVPKFRSTIKNFDWDTVAFPVSSDNKILIDTSGWAVSKKSTKKADAVDFIKYMSSRDVIEKIAEQGLIVPARIDVSNSPAFLSGLPQNSRAFIDIIDYSKPTPVNTNYLFLNDMLNETLEDVFAGKKKAEEVLNESFKKKAEALL